MSYPVLYKANETDFSHLGLGVLNETASALVTEERNGLFELEMKYPVDGALIKEIKNDRLIKVDASNNLKDQRFKIIRITKPAKGLVTIYAEHISYLTQDLPLEPEVEYFGDASIALDIWKNNIVDDHPFTTYSDILTEGKGKWTINEVESARRALGGIDGSILDSYGGEYRFDNYHIGLYAQRGNDSGALIAYGKNLTDLEQEEEIASTYTSVYPYSIVRNEEDDTEEILTLPERFTDSAYVDNYARRKILTVDFSSEEIATVAQLRTRTQRYIIENNVGIPKVNLRVKFLDLAKTLDYKNLKIVEETNLCDLVTIYFEKLSIFQKAKIIKTIWDVLLDRYDGVEVGEARASLSNSVNAIVDGKVDRIENQLNIVHNAANGKNKVFRGIGEPANGMSKNDIWYKPVGDGEVEMYIYNGDIWKLESYSADALNGTINAANVNLINLNASNMATGTLVGGKVYFNLTNGTLLLGNSAEDYKLYFDGTTLKIRGDIDISNNETIKDIQENIISIKTDISGITTVVKEEIGKSTKTIEVYGINIISNKPENWEQGFIDEDTGEEWDMDDPYWKNFTQFGYDCRIRTKDYIEIDPTKFYVFSEQFLFKIYSTDIQIYFYDAENNYLDYRWHYHFIDPETTPEGTAKIRVSLMEAYQYGGSPIVNITPQDIADSYFKIEQGTEATDWTPCISDVSLNANLDNVKIGDEPDNPDDGTLWLAEFILASQLLCFSGDDWIAVGWGEIREILDRVNEVEVKQSQIVQTIDGITQTVQNKADKSYVDQTASDVTLKFEQLSVGGENLLLKSDVPITSSSYLIKAYDIPEHIVDGEEVTLQIKGYLGDGKFGFGIYNSGGTVQMATLNPEDIRNGNIYTKTFKWRIEGSSNTAIHIYVLYSSVTVDSNIEWIKLERGNKPTDKSPHKSELKGSTYRFDKDGFSIGGTGGDTAQHTNSQSKYNHSDGSYTQISSGGLKRFIAGTGENYHYLLHIVNFIYGESSSAQAYWIQLPNSFKGKQFKVYFAISDSMNAPSYKYAIQRFVCTRHPDFGIDYANARVPVIAYKSNTLSDGLAPILNEVQGIMLAIY